jgi:hypothetical protein
VVPKRVVSDICFTDEDEDNEEGTTSLRFLLAVGEMSSADVTLVVSSACDGEEIGARRAASLVG